MEYTNAELLDLVERYKAESGIPIGNDIKLGFAVFARWLLSQKLQQCSVSGELPIYCVNDFEKTEYCSQRNNHLCQKCKDW